LGTQQEYQDLHLDAVNLSSFPSEAYGVLEPVENLLYPSYYPILSLWLLVSKRRSINSDLRQKGIHYIHQKWLQE
jgi:hypothetical protein